MKGFIAYYVEEDFRFNVCKVTPHQDFQLYASASPVRISKEQSDGLERHTSWIWVIPRWGSRRICENMILKEGNII